MCFLQLRAATAKSLLQKSYSPGSFLVEMLLPIIFILGAVALWSNSTDTIVPAKSFIPNTTDYEVPDFTINTTKFFCMNLTVAEYASSPMNGILNMCIPSIPKTCLGTDPTGSPTPIEFPGFCFYGNLSGRRGLSSTLRGFTAQTTKPQYVRRMDDLVILQYAAKRIVPDSIRRRFTDALASMSRSGRLYFAPNNAGTQALIDYINTTAKDSNAGTQLFKYVYGNTFNSEADATNFAIKDENADNFWALIIIEKWEANDLKFTIRMNRTSLPLTSIIRRQFAVDGLGRNEIRRFSLTGYHTLQQLIYEAYAYNVHSKIISATGNDQPRANHSAVIAPMPYAQYINNDFLNLAGAIAPLLIVLGYLYPVSQLTRGIVEEKELRVREAMLIMGLGRMSFYGSWVIVYSVMHVIISLVIAGICKGTMLNDADFGVILFLFILFGFSTISLSLLLSSFFSKARVSALMSPLIFFVLSIPAFALPPETPASVFAGLGILSPTAFSLGLRLLFNYEIIGGLQTGDFASTLDDVNMATVYALLIVDIFLYFFLALYFDSVLPSEWGTKEHPLLCLAKPWQKLVAYCCGSCSSTCCSCDDDDDEDDHDQRLYLAVPPPNKEGILDGRVPGGKFEDPQFDDEQTSVRIKGVRKDFILPDNSTLRAVNHMALDLQHGQVFALLGRNGQGKTTLINLMTGMLEADDGDTLIYGNSVKDKLTEVRQNIGFCPQHNILWPDLTCMEHLHFFAALKGLTGQEAEDASKQMLKEVDLYAKRFAQAGTLSGGQKRKLSVAIAFIGGSKMIFLDEPTAGQDVEARRATWDVIRRYSKDRTILLCSHFMDEVEILGDTIAIMEKGRLHCLGSRTFLKSNLGVGYTLTLALKNLQHQHHHHHHHHHQHHHPEMNNNDKTETTAATSSSPSSAFPVHDNPQTAADIANGVDRDALLALVQKHVPSAFVLASPPAEIMIKLPTTDIKCFPTLLRDVEENAEKFGATGFGVNATTLEEIFVKIGEESTEKEAADKELSRLRKLDRKAKKSSSSSAARREIHVSSSHPDNQPNHTELVIVTNLQEPSESFPSSPQSSQSTSPQSTSPQTSSPQTCSPQVCSPQVTQAPLFEQDEKARVEVSFWWQLKVLLLKRFHYARRDTRTIVLQLIVPVISLLCSMGLASLQFPVQPKLLLAPSSWQGTETVLTECSGLPTSIVNAKLKDATILSTPITGYTTLPDNILGVQSYLLDTAKAHGTERLAAFACNATTPLAVPLPFILSNESYPHASAVGVSEYYSMYIRAVLNNVGLNLDNYLHPLPFSQRAQAFFDSLTALLVGIFVMVPFAIIPSVFVSFVVKERETQAKHLQLVMGLQIIPYWIANLIFDVLAFLITNFMAIFVFLIFNRAEYIGNGENFGATFMLFFVYSFSGTAMAYAMSFAFDSHTVAQNVVMLFNFIFGFLLVILIFVLSFLPDTKEAAKTITWVLRIVPAYALGDGIINVAIAESTRIFDPNAKGSFDVTIAGYDLIYMSCVFPVLFAFTLWMDYLGSSAEHVMRWLKDNLFCWFCAEKTDRDENSSDEEDEENGGDKNAAASSSKKPKTTITTTTTTTTASAAAAAATATTTSSSEATGTGTSAIPAEEQQQTAGVTAETSAVTSATTSASSADHEHEQHHQHHLVVHHHQKMDDDVLAEEDRILNTEGIEHQDIIVTKHLRKCFPGSPDPVVANHDVTLGIHSNECFALLGTNGAGKTSYIKQLCGEFPPTSGVGYVGGFNTATETIDVRRILGYTPQFDALIDLLTIEEHFDLYCGLRGVEPGHSTERLSEKLINLAGLADHRGKTAESLSGGNRRKLSFALALIGAPKVVFLDEPTAGMDATARRQLWKLIERVSRDCAVVLCTHHLEEVEALAHRCGMMVDGRLKCLGSLQHLKTKFGSGFEVQIRVKEQTDVAPCKTALVEQLPNLVWEEERGTKLAGTLPQDVKLSEVFAILQEKSDIEDYTVSQSSIEQVFLRIAAEAVERQGDF